MIRLEHIRKEQADEAFLFELYASVREEEMKLWGWDRAQQEMFLRLQFEMQRRSYEMQFPGLIERLIWLGDERAGRLMTAASEEAVRVVDIALLGAYRNQGIGTQVLKEACRQASEANLPVRLTVRNDNRARRLYERLGFAEVGRDEMNAYMERAADGAGIGSRL